jgi:hypothetical protein
MLAPHHAEDAEFGKRGLAIAEKAFDFLVFLGREPVLPERGGRKGRSRSRGHGEALLSHLAGILGSGFITPKTAPFQALRPFR